MIQIPNDDDDLTKKITIGKAAEHLNADLARLDIPGTERVTEVEFELMHSPVSGALLTDSNGSYLKRRILTRAAYTTDRLRSGSDALDWDGRTAFEQRAILDHIGETARVNVQRYVLEHSPACYSTDWDVDAGASVGGHLSAFHSITLYYHFDDTGPVPS